MGAVSRPAPPLHPPAVIQMGQDFLRFSVIPWGHFHQHVALATDSDFVAPRSSCLQNPRSYLLFTHHAVLLLFSFLTLFRTAHDNRLYIVASVCCVLLYSCAVIQQHWVVNHFHYVQTLTHLLM